MTTGQLIKAARKRAGLTQSALATKLGIPYQSIGQWERDIRNPKYETIKKIAVALEIDWTDLVPEENQATVIIDHIKNRLSSERQSSDVPNVCVPYNTAPSDVDIDGESIDELSSKYGFSVIDIYPAEQSKIFKDGFHEGWAAKDLELQLSFGYSFSDDEIAAINAFSKLNDEGKQKAIERIQELMEIPKYQRSVEDSE